MIWELLSGFFLGGSILEACGLILLYRQYLILAESSLEYAAMVIESIEESDEGALSLDPVALAGYSMDHLSQISGLVKWIRP